jgi:3-phosphoshikimate 1-carboxyvinyltransferase
VAASSTEMWCDILLANAAHVDGAITTFMTRLEALRRAITGGDRAALREQLARARAARRQWNVSP